MPPVQANTIGLWLIPVITLFGGGLVILVFIRQQRRGLAAGAVEAEDEERARRLDAEEGLD